MTLPSRILLPIVALLAVSCGGGSPPVSTPSATVERTPDPASRPSSPVTVRIVSPQPNAVVHGATMHIVIAIAGGTVVKVTSTHVQPDQGHVHVYLDSNLIYMNYTLEQDVPVHVGETGTLRAEFVAADHFPFNPRVTTPDQFFSVQP